MREEKKWKKRTIKRMKIERKKRRRGEKEENWNECQILFFPKQVLDWIHKRKKEKCSIPFFASSIEFIHSHRLLTKDGSFSFGRKNFHLK